MSDAAQSHEVFAGKLIRVRVEQVTHQDGSTSQYEIVEHPEAVAVVAVRDTEEGEHLVALVHQRRPAIGKETWELPAGLVNPDERGDPQRTAARELREETGYEAEHFELLNRHYSSPGFTDEVISLYLATDLRQAGEDARPDPHEIANVEWKPFGVVMEMCRRGEIEDGKTLIGFLLAREALPELD